MTRRIGSGILVCAIGLATVVPSFAQPQPQGAVLGKPVVRDAAPRDGKPGDENTLPRVLLNQKPTPIASQPPPAAAPAPAGTPVLGAPIPCAVEQEPFVGRFTIRGDGGNGVGYSRGFSTLQAMIPLKQTNGSLFFTDVRMVNFNDENRWEGNAGVGYRWFSEPVNRILGVNAFYDARKSDYHLYQQIGVGIEALSPNIEFRMNGYFIMGPAHRLVGDVDFYNVGVINGNNVIARRQTLEVARGGGDIEIGGRLPFLDRFAPRAYVSFYTYSAENVKTANGARGRLEAQLTQQISAHFSIQNDRVFDTTIAGGLAIHFGAPAYRTGNCGRASWEDVLRQRVVRDVNIVLSQGAAIRTVATPVPPPPPPPPPPSQDDGPIS